MYDPSTARFLQPNPPNFNSSDSANLYLYSNNDPVNFTNPNGHETDKSFPSNGINFLPALLIADFLAIIFGIDEQFPRKLTEEEIKLYSRLFPNFDPTKVTVIGPATDRLNCIAHACGLNSGWIDHSKGPPNCAVKPPKAALAITLEYAEQVLACYGFAKSENCKCEKGKIKVALYGLKRKGFGAGMIYHVKHAARCYDGGNWTSKLGTDILIEHSTLEILENKGKGEFYGDVIGCYEKVLETAPPPREAKGMCK